MREIISACKSCRQRGVSRERHMECNNNNVGVTAGKASHNASNARGVTAGKMGRNSRTKIELNLACPTFTYRL